MSNKVLHQPVMVEEAVSALKIKPNQWYIDATFGRGGHTQAMLEKKALVIAFDFDQEAIDYGRKQFEQEIEDKKLILVRENFANLKQAVTDLKLQNQRIGAIKGILFDFGTTQDQLKSQTRGFSFDQPESELDMRMDQRLGVKASDLLTVMPVKQLTEVFKNFGGEHQAKAIAKAIDRYRGPERSKKIETAGELVKIIEQVKHRRGKLHPATKVFQALRIAVNDELNNIEQGLDQSLKVLNPPARIVTIAFHAGEDRIAKHRFKSWQEQEKGSMLYKKPKTAAPAEVEENPAARSAKFRVFNYQPA